MEALFLKLFNMSVSAGWIVLAILLLRLIIRKSPKWINVALWILVAVRLCVPFSLKSILSIIPSTNTIPQEIIATERPVIESGFEAVDSAVNPIITENLAPSVTESVNPIAIILSVTVAVWLIGIAVMLTYMVISYLRIYFRIREGVPDGDNTMLCDRINTPFVMGIVRPKIYLPSSMDESYKPYVIAHENVHIKRRDYLWKLLAFAFLTVYWFNPLVWVAYIIFSRDIEFACDEKVIKKYGEEYKAAYSTALLNCSIKKKSVNINPLAFGEVSVKSRIKNILKYKKPSLWISVISVVLIIALGVFFLTDPLDKEITDKAKKEDKITETVTYEIVEDTTSEPEETVTSIPTENTSQETEPQNTETSKQQETVSTPTQSNKVLTAAEQKKLIEHWLNTPALEDNKVYFNTKNFSEQGYNAIVIYLTRKATKETYDKVYTLEDFPEIQGKFLMDSSLSTMELIKEGKMPSDLDFKTFRRTLNIEFKYVHHEELNKIIRQLEKREDIYKVEPEVLGYAE